MNQNNFTAGCSLWIDREYYVRQFEKDKFKIYKHNHTTFSKKYTEWLEQRLWKLENKDAPANIGTAGHQPTTVCKNKG